MSPRPNVSEERQDQIIEAATRVFSARGFNSARMDDIVAESGLSKGTLYWYFESKEALITAIVDRVFDTEEIVVKPMSTMLRDNWFHYSGDYRIGTRYLDEPILDNIKQQAMQVPFLKELLRNDWIYIRNNIKVHDMLD